MLPDLVTVCVLAVGDSRSTDRTLASLVEPNGPVLVVAPDEDHTRSVEAIVAPERGLDPVELWDLALSRVETPWALLLVSGEEVTLPARDALAEDLRSAQDALAPLEHAGPSLVPDPLAFPGPRLVRPGTPLRWALDEPLVEVERPATTALVLRRRPAPYDRDSASAGWLRHVLARRAHGRTERATVAETALESAALAWAGELDAAVVRAQSILSASSTPARERALAGRVLLGAGLSAGRLIEARQGAAAWRATDPGGTAPRAWTALLAALSGELSLADDLPSIASWSHEADAAPDPWMALGALGRVQTARIGLSLRADAYVELLATAPDAVAAADVQRLVQDWGGLARDFGDLVRQWPEKARPLLADYVENQPIMEPAQWSTLALAYVEAHGLSEGILKRLRTSAPVLTTEVTLSWAVKLHAAGLDGASLLRDRASSPYISPKEKVLSAAVALEVFHDQEAIDLLAAAARLVPVDELRSLLLSLDLTAPSALPAAVRGAASTAPRARHLASLYEEFGDQEAAAALSSFAAELG